MTALAAVIALSSTPLLAQSADVPVVATPAPVVDVTPAPVAVDPIAPVADPPVAADPVVTKTTTPVRKTTATKTSAARARPAPARVTNTARPAAAAPAAAIAAPVAEAPPIEQPLSPPTEIAADPIAQTPATATTIDVLPTAGLGGLGLLLLGGAGLAIRSRRRRRAEEAEDAEWQQQQAEAEPEVVAEPELVLAAPAVVAAAAPQPTAESGTEFIGPETELSEDFDISRFGPNMQDAYRGPTEDNPSLSLKTRLSRASGMDQQERKLDAEVEAATGEPALDETVATTPAAAPAAKPSVIRHVDGDFILGRAGKKPIVRPTYTH